MKKIKINKSIFAIYCPLVEKIMKNQYPRKNQSVTKAISNSIKIGYLVGHIE